MSALTMKIPLVMTMKIQFLLVFVAPTSGRSLKEQRRHDAASLSVFASLPAPAPFPAVAKRRADDFGNELMDQMRKPGEDMFAEACEPICKSEVEVGEKGFFDIEITKSMWNVAQAPSPAPGGYGPPPFPPFGGFTPEGIAFMNAVEKKKDEECRARKLSVMLRIVNETFTDSKGNNGEFDRQLAQDGPLSNLPGKLRMYYEEMVWQKKCSPYGCKDRCMDYGHFVDFCRQMVNVQGLRNLPQEMQLFNGNGLSRKCIRGEAAGCTSEDYASSPRLDMKTNSKCRDLQCKEFCTVFQSRSTEQVCACDAAYLGVPKSQDEHDRDCLKPETFSRLSTSADVFGFATLYVSDKTSKEEKSTFDGLDKDHDGFITRQEAQGSTGWSPLHTCADENGDGKVSQEEYKNKTVRGIASCSEIQKAFDEKCKSFDDNGDGKIQYEEWAKHHQDPVHVLTVESIADWNSWRVNEWWRNEIDQFGYGWFVPRRGIMVDSQNQVLELHGAMRNAWYGRSHDFGNASKESFERMKFPLQYRYTVPYGLFGGYSETGDFRSPVCVDLNSNGVVELEECRAMGTEKRKIAQSCAECTYWSDRAGAQEDLVLTAAEASSCFWNEKELEAANNAPSPSGAPKMCATGFGLNMVYPRFHCLDANHDFRVTADECKAEGEQFGFMDTYMSPWEADVSSADKLRAWGDSYFKYKAGLVPAPAPYPATSGFLQSIQQPHPSIVPAPAISGMNRPLTYAECMNGFHEATWPNGLVSGSPGPAPGPATSFNVEFDALDKNHDGKVSRQEAYDYAAGIPGGDILSTKVDQLFKDADLDLDNLISADEYASAGLNHHGDGPGQ